MNTHDLQGRNHHWGSRLSAWKAGGGPEAIDGDGSKKLSDGIMYVAMWALWHEMRWGSWWKPAEISRGGGLVGRGRATNFVVGNGDGGGQL